MDELMEMFPEAFKRAQHPNAGLCINSWVGDEAE